MPWLVVAALGLFIGDLAASPPWPMPVLVTACSLGAVLSLVAPAASSRRLGVALLSLALGYSDADLTYRPWLRHDHIANLRLPATVTLRGRLVSDPEILEHQTRLAIAATERRDGDHWQPASGLVIISTRALDDSLHADDGIEVVAALRRPRNFGNPGEFDYEAHLARRGIYVTGFANDHDLTLLDRGEGWTSAMSHWRAAARAAFHAGLPEADAKLMDALILGTQRELPEALQEAFRRTGTSHILAISGLNVGLVAGASFATIRWMLGRSHWLLLAGNVPKLATSLSFVPVLLYTGIAGTNLATLRALVMLLVLLGAVVVDRQQTASISLAVALVAILVLWPGSSRDPSFQLSFAAVVGLVFGIQRFSPWWRRYEEKRLLRLRGWRGQAERAVGLFVAVSVCANAATTPLVAFHFNQVSLVSFAANAIAVPLLGSIAVGLGLLSALSALFSATLAACFAALAWPALWAGREAVELFARIPYAALKVVSLSLFELMLIYLALSSAFWGRYGRTLLASVAIVGIADGSWCWWQRYHHSDLVVSFLSVGQGDAAVVEIPGGAVMVVDGGGLRSGSFDVGERIIAPYLWSRKIARIDYIAISHPQWDHYGGLRYLVEQFAPRELWWNGSRTDALTFAQLLTTARDYGTHVVELHQGDDHRIGAVEVATLAPVRNVGLSLNDGSLVLKLRYNARSILFTGDIEAIGEANLQRSNGDALESTILKVPHHGSSTSSTAGFLAAVNPEVAIISLGYDNRYGFPNPRVLRRYAARGTTMRRTDGDGAIEVRIAADGTYTVARTRSS